MKSDIALHEIMRIDEYAEEDTQEDPQIDLAEKPTAKAATPESTESATDNSDSSSSVDIPTDTVINYDEPPTELIEAPADLTVMSNDITPSELADMPAAEDISSDDETSTESAELPTEPAIDYEASLPDSTYIPTTEAIINDDETSTESAELPTEPAIDYEASLPDSTYTPTTEAIINDDETSTESFAKQVESIPANTAGFFEEVILSITDFFKNNRQLLTNLGIISLAFIATKLAFAGLNAIDDIPLVSPLLKLVGLYYVGRFVWNYLIRERDRQQLVEQFNGLKSQVLGDRN
jgi:hypothetical protein